MTGQRFIDARTATPTITSLAVDPQAAQLELLTRPLPARRPGNDLAPWVLPPRRRRTWRRRILAATAVTTGLGALFGAGVLTALATKAYLLALAAKALGVTVVLAVAATVLYLLLRRDRVVVSGYSLRVSRR
jgi:hypothetical protein